MIYYQITTKKENEDSVISITFSNFILMVSGMISGTVVICIIGCLCGVKYRTAHKQASDSKSEDFSVTTSAVLASDPVYDEVDNVRPSAGIEYSQNISYGHGTVVTHL